MKKNLALFQWQAGSCSLLSVNIISFNINVLLLVVISFIQPPIFQNVFALSFGCSAQWAGNKIFVLKEDQL